MEVALFESPQWEPAVMAHGGAKPRPVAIGGSGKVKAGRANEIGYQSADYVKRAIELQGLPSDFLKDAPFTVAGKCEAIGNGVPLPMGRAVAKAVRHALLAHMAATAPAAGRKHRTTRAPRRGAEGHRGQG
jgi:DNA (cytosine-5)-methyltransferase 1